MEISSEKDCRRGDIARSNAVQARWLGAIEQGKALISLELLLESAFHSSRYVEKESDKDNRKKQAIGIESHTMAPAKAIEQNKSQSPCQIGQAMNSEAA